MAAVGLSSVLLRFFLAFVAGSVIGWEREFYEDVPVDHRGSVYRLYTLACLGACFFTVAGQYGFGGQLSAPDRIASNVVTGIGFLGAGLILKDKQGEVRGLPSAVGIWISSAIGLLFGAGSYLAGAGATVFAFFVIHLPHWFPGLFNKNHKRQ